MTLSFKLPIETNEHSILDETLLKDLEILETKQNNDETKPLFDIMYSPTHPVDSLIKKPLMTCYTTDVSFLTQKQEFIKQIHGVSLTPHDNLTKTFDIIQDIKEEDDFHSKYQYIETDLFKRFNHNPHIMQLLSVYNMVSPLITLLTPIVILVLPFFLIRFQGISMSFNSYFSSIKSIIKNHAIGKLLDIMGPDVSWEKRVYILISVGFYLLQVYQNAMACYRFTTNMVHIHSSLFDLRDYVEQSCRVIKEINLITKTNNLNTFNDFSAANATCLSGLEKLLKKLRDVSPLRISFGKAVQIGHVMHLYYSIRYDTTISEAIDYSLSLNSYLNTVKQLANNKFLNNATYTQSDAVLCATNTNTKSSKSSSKTNKPEWVIKNMKYPHFIKTGTECDKQITDTDTDLGVGNTFNLKKPILLTGPNASGKTTLLKSALLNTLLAQQIGVGCFDSFILKPYHKFYSYLDIPDTSGRDSLFQAEARRCLDIISDISANASNRYFCIFDELYSGTNPTEAVASSFAFVKLLTEHSNTDFILTTHFYDLCGLIKKHKINIKNMQMSWEYVDHTVQTQANKKSQSHSKRDIIDKETKYTYVMETGVSKMRGGIRVLKQLEYPENVIKDASNILKGYV